MTFFYMIGSWRVVLTFTIAFYTYQSTFLSKKLNVEEKLTGRFFPYCAVSKQSWWHIDIDNICFWHDVLLCHRAQPPDSTVLSSNVRAKNRTLNIVRTWRTTALQPLTPYLTLFGCHIPYSCKEKHLLLFRKSEILHF